MVELHAAFQETALGVDEAGVRVECPYRFMMLLGEVIFSF